MSLEPEQLEQLSKAVDDLTKVMSTLPLIMATAMGKTEVLGKAFVDASAGVDKYTAAQIKAQQEKDRVEQKVQEAQFAGITALRSFASAVQDTSASVRKYAGTVQGGFDFLSNASESLSGKFGLIGQVGSVVAKGLGIVSERLLTYNAQLIESYQTLADLGVGAGITSEEIAELGRRSNFSGEALLTFSKVTRAAGTDLIGLGGTVTEGIRAFGRFTAIGEKAARQLNYLGVSTEQFLNFQQQFLAQEIKAGLATGRGEQAMNDLTRASMSLYKEMMLQAELTGRSVEDQVKQREYLSAISNFQVYNLQRIRDVQKQEDVLGKEEVELRIKRIKDEARLTLDAVNRIYTIAGKDLATSAITRLSSDSIGVISTASDIALENLLSQFGGATQVLSDIKDSASRGVDSTVRLQNIFVEAGLTAVDRLKGYTALPLEAFDDIRLNVFGATDELLSNTTQRLIGDAELTTQQRQNEYARQREVAELTLKARFEEAESIIGAKDAAMIFSTTLLAQERLINRVISEAASTINTPFLALATVAIGLFAALGSLILAATQAAAALRGLPGSIPGSGPITTGPDKGRGPKEKPDSIILGPDGKPIPRDTPDLPEERGGKGGRFGRIGRFGGGIVGILGGTALGYAENELRESGRDTAADAVGVAGNAAMGAGIASMIAPFTGPFAPLTIGVGALAGATYGLIDAVNSNTSSQQDLVEEGILTTPKDETTQVTTQATAANVPTQTTQVAAQAPVVNQPTQIIQDPTLRQQVQTLQAMTSSLAPLQQQVQQNRDLQESEEFTFTTTRQFARSRAELARSNEEFAASQDLVGQQFTDFSTSLREATRNLRQLSGITILEETPTENEIEFSEETLNDFKRILGTAYTYDPNKPIRTIDVGPDITYTPQFGELPQSLQQFLAATRQVESVGGTKLRPVGLGNTTTIGGQYHMGQAAREEAFKNMTQEERARMAELGFGNQAPKLTDLILNDSEFKQGMKEADDLLAKSFVRLTVAALQHRLKREPTAADLRGAWWHGADTYAKIVETAQTNPDMLVGEFYSKMFANNPRAMPDVTQFGTRTLAQQLQFVQRQMADVNKINVAASTAPRTDRFGQFTANDTFDIYNVNAGLNDFYNKRNAQFGNLTSGGFPNINRPSNIFGNNLSQTSNANVSSSLTVSTSKDNPLVTVDYSTSSSMTSLVDLNKIQTSELTALNSKINDLNGKIDMLNNIQQKLLERTTA